MVDIALTNLLTEKPSLLCHLRSELGLFCSVSVPPFLTCGTDYKEVCVLSQRRYQSDHLKGKHIYILGST